MHYRHKPEKVRSHYPAICQQIFFELCSLGTLGIGVLSYNGGLCVSVAADSVPETRGVARQICDRFEKRFQVYVERAREIVDRY